VGGASISKYVAENPAKLRADVALVSDTAMYAEGMPTLCIGLRGLIYMEVEATGAMRDLHSGLYGGAAPNAVYGLIELLAKAKNADGAIQIPGIYDAVEEPAPAELESWRGLPFDEREFLVKEVGATALTGEPDRTVLERVWSRPTFEVHGIAGGFTAAGAKTVIPAKATAKVSIRLVPRQDRIGWWRHSAIGCAPTLRRGFRRRCACSAPRRDWWSTPSIPPSAWPRRRSEKCLEKRPCSSARAARFRSSAISAIVWASRPC